MLNYRHWLVHHNHNRLGNLNNKTFLYIIFLKNISEYHIISLKITISYNDYGTIIVSSHYYNHCNNPPCPHPNQPQHCPLQAPLATVTNMSCLIRGGKRMAICSMERDLNLILLFSVSERGHFWLGVQLSYHYLISLLSKSSTAYYTAT